MVEHDHPHGDADGHSHGHSHGLVDPAIKRSREGLRAVGLSLAVVRIRAGRRLASAALIADGEHARADALVSLAVVASAGLVALGADVADPLIGLGITAVILRITWHSWKVVRAGY